MYDHLRCITTLCISCGYYSRLKKSGPSSFLLPRPPASSSQSPSTGVMYVLQYSFMYQQWPTVELAHRRRVLQRPVPVRLLLSVPRRGFFAGGLRAMVLSSPVAARRLPERCWTGLGAFFFFVADRKRLRMLVSWAAGTGELKAGEARDVSICALVEVPTWFNAPA